MYLARAQDLVSTAADAYSKNNSISFMQAFIPASIQRALGFSVSAASAGGALANNCTKNQFTCMTTVAISLDYMQHYATGNSTVGSQGVKYVLGKMGLPLTDVQAEQAYGTIVAAGGTAALLKQPIGVNGLSNIVANDAIQIINAASSNNQLKLQAAVSRARVSERELTTPAFVNLPGSANDFPGVTKINNQTYIINNPAAYINEVKRIYSSSGSPLQDVTRGLIINYIGDGSKVFSNFNGLPGLHAEVRAYNDLVRNLPPGFDNRNIVISTYKLYPGPEQGSPFPACINCGGILPSTVHIQTGVK